MTITELHNLAELIAETSQRLHSATKAMIDHGINDIRVESGSVMKNIVELRVFADEVEKKVKG